MAELLHLSSGETGFSEAERSDPLWPMAQRAAVILGTTVSCWLIVLSLGYLIIALV